MYITCLLFRQIDSYSFNPLILADEIPKVKVHYDTRSGRCDSVTPVFDRVIYTGESHPPRGGGFRVSHCLGPRA